MSGCSDTLDRNRMERSYKNSKSVTKSRNEFKELRESTNIVDLKIFKISLKNPME